MKPTFRICDLCSSSFSLPDDSCQEEPIEIPNTPDRPGYDLCRECVKTGTMEACKQLPMETRQRIAELTLAWAHGTVLQREWRKKYPVTVDGVIARYSETEPFPEIVWPEQAAAASLPDDGELARLREENEQLWRFVGTRPCECRADYDKDPQQCDRCYLLLGRK